MQVQAAAVAEETLLSTSASSNVDGNACTRIASASTTTNDLDLDVLNTNFLSLVTETAVNVSSSTIYSEASVSGDYGSLNAMGTSYVEDLSINLFGLGELDLASLGLQVDADCLIQTSPNFEVLNVSGIAGLNLILNEQYGECTDMFCSMGVNALRLSFNAVDLTGLGLNIGNLDGLLNGDIVIGHSYAELTAQINEVPAPATLGIFSLVMLALGLSKRKSK
ncbi:PEP-CTERM sorting domain-containing protein [Salinimonas iocasae]|uniref:PEP-CTERM sorting domain-containing protein n=1 Tax=Salinimonas iocasae TaxID=2572577 RepID=A0A5B7YBE1_9ALTE|nr:PEP-CTERM sorting domain-containing protein [Salinimonas iocasae]QCZ92516.1 PEP-CTERM sorting domain-containing protein [Salinimonas iocasae]